MAGKNTDVDITVASIDTPVIPEKEPALSGPGPVGPARVFQDKVYTSRTLIMPDGSQIPVLKGRAVAFGDDQFRFLNNHPDLERIAE